MRFRFFISVLLIAAFATKAPASVDSTVKHDFTITIAGYNFGYSDGETYGWGYINDWKKIHLGPLGQRSLPYSPIADLIWIELKTEQAISMAKLPLLGFLYEWQLVPLLIEVATAI